MVKKVQKTAAKQKSKGKASLSSGLFDSQLAGAVKGSAQQIWLAGMGAFAKAQAEGGKMFDTLVKEGTSLQRKTQAVAEDRLGDMAGKVSSMASDVSSKAGASWDKLETLFEERTSKALAKLGVPTSRDVTELKRRIDELAASVARLSKSRSTAASSPAEPAAAKPRKRKAAAAPATPARKTTARKSAAKPVAKKRPRKTSGATTQAGAGS